MRLKIENVGKIHNPAEVEIDGITVVSGINGAGKSTIGKCLYTIYSAFFELDEKIIVEKYKYVRKILADNVVSVNSKALREIALLANSLVEDFVRDEQMDIVSRISGEILPLIDRDNIGDIASKIEDALHMPDDSIVKMIFEDKVFSEFGNNCVNVNHSDENAEMGVILKTGEINCKLTSQNTEIKRNIDITKNITYLTDTSVLDQLSGNYPRAHTRFSLNMHEADLVHKLISEEGMNSGVINDAISNKKLDNVIAQFEKINVGKLIKTGAYDYGYKSKELKGSIELINVSAGVKELVILRQLIENGAIEEKGILIFDEPEIHLHPEWQKVLAEIIVLLQKEFKLNILISTHSADFLSFIELYSRNYSISNLCKYYLVENEKDGDGSCVRDVTKNIDEIYQKLGDPFIQASEELNESDAN